MAQPKLFAMIVHWMHDCSDNFNQTQHRQENGEQPELIRHAEVESQLHKLMVFLFYFFIGRTRLHWMSFSCKN